MAAITRSELFSRVELFGESSDLIGELEPAVQRETVTNNVRDLHGAFIGDASARTIAVSKEFFAKQKPADLTKFKKGLKEMATIISKDSSESAKGVLNIINYFESTLLNTPAAAVPGPSSSVAGQADDGAFMRYAGGVRKASEFRRTYGISDAAHKLNVAMRESSSVRQDGQRVTTDDGTVYSIRQKQDATKGRN